MENLSKSPTYNLKVVIQETGLKADTLRAWERRYGLPQPERTSGGHRLYSQYDIEMIKWLMARQDEGLRIKRAVELWRNFERSGQDPLEQMPVKAKPVKPTYTTDLSGKVLDEIKEEWVRACMAFDETRAENILAQAFARYPIETVCLDVLTAGLADIGEAWYTGKTTVQQEHFASALATRRLNALLASAPPPTRSGRILSACPPGEDHIYPLLLTTLFLRLQGWDVVYLGANVPINKLDEAIRSSKPQLMISSVQQLHTAAELYKVALFLEEVQLPLAYGGLIFNLIPGLRERIPGYFLGETLNEAVQSVELIMLKRLKTVSKPPVPEKYIQAADHFHDRQPAIAAELWNEFHQNGMHELHLENANLFLGKDIEAGLILGDMDLLEHEIEWLSGLLNSHNIDLEYLPTYLELYKKAVEDNLDQRGEPVIEWLSRVTNELVVSERE